MPMKDPAYNTPVTYASMIHHCGDSRVSTIGIYRGRMIGRKGHRYVNSNAPTTQLVTRVTVVCGVMSGDYQKAIERLEREHGTPEAPAVDWSA